MASHPHFLWKDLFRRKRKNHEHSVLDVLKQNVLFCTLSRRELRYISTLVYERIYQPDEPVFMQNDRALGMYVVVKGRIGIKTHTPEGETFITSLGEGSFFGETALIEPDTIRTASAIAQERAIIIGFFKPDLIEILERKPAMGVKILFQLASVLGRRLLETTEKITGLKQELKLYENKKVASLHEEVV